MKKLNTAPISGMQELLPAEQNVFDKYKKEIEKVFLTHGFLRIETPTIDRAEILFAKAGGETEKQIYKVVKTEETADSADQALRFDHTVPLARYVTEHESNLTFPFKVTQIERNFRGERAQKGRFREFYQCDIDVIGRNTLPIEYDAEVIYTLFSALKRMDLPEFVVRVSNRKILSGLLEALNLLELSKEIFSVIDHAEKVSIETTRKKFEELGLKSELIEKLLSLIGISGDTNEVKNELRKFEIKNKKLEEGVLELEKVSKLLNLWGLEKDVIFDLKIVRGLDYYTGTVFETNLKDYKEIGSICSGGRYENLAELYTDQVLPGVGGSIGLTRLFFILNEYGLIKAGDSKPVELAIIPFSETQLDYCFKLAEKYREDGKSVDVVLLDKKLGDKVKYASRVAKFGVVIGENEIETGELKIKDFSTGETVSM